MEEGRSGPARRLRSLTTESHSPVHQRKRQNRPRGRAGGFEGGSRTVGPDAWAPVRSVRGGRVAVGRGQPGKRTLWAVAVPGYDGGDAGRRGAGDDDERTRRLGRPAEDTGGARGSRCACFDPAFRRPCDRRLYASLRSIRDRFRSPTRSTSQSPTATP